MLHGLMPGVNSAARVGHKRVHKTLWPSGQGVGLLSRWGLPAWVRIPQVSIFQQRLQCCARLGRRSLRRELAKEEPRHAMAREHHAI